MMNWTDRLSGPAVLGFILASLAPGCDGAPATGANMTNAGAGGMSGGAGTQASVDAGAGGMSGGAGTQASVDTGGAGGTSEDAGGTGGTTGSNCQADPDPTPELLPNAQLDASVIARAAVVLGSCGFSDDGLARTSAQLWSANIAGRRKPYLDVTQAQCLADAHCGCEAMEHCLGLTLETGVAPGCQSSCSGEVFRGCGESADLIDGYAFNVDCARVGLRCDPSNFCLEDVPTACDATGPLMCRAGARPLYCDDDGTVREGPDCAALGLGCASGQCQGTGAACTNQDLFPTGDIISFDAASCQGGTLEACVSGQLATLACAEQGPGFDCQSVDGVSFCGLASECLPADVDGDPSNPAATCDGTRLTFCNAGKLETLDCADLGFTGCEVDSDVGHYGCTPSLSF